MRALAQHGVLARRRLREAAGLLTTPLLPDDFLGLVDPLWSRRQVAGRVVAVMPETPTSATIAIRPGRGWRGHRAGQYVRLGVEVDGVRHHRAYSLTSPPRAADGCIAVTVRAIPGGVVSAQLVHRTTPGTVVGLGAAAGDFVLTPDAPQRLLFVAAGSGITPVIGILRALMRDRDQRGARDVAVVHVARSPEQAIFARELRALAGRGALTLHEHHTARSGRPSPAELTALVPDWRERAAWACGPGAMLDAIESHFADAGAAGRLRVERFRPRVATGGDGTVAAEGGRVRFVRSGIAVDAGGATSLLAAGEAAGALLPSGCRMGNCRTCVGTLRSGVVRDLRTGEVSGTAGDVIQTCISVAAGPVEVEL